MRHATALAAGLPLGSRTLEKINPKTKYTEAEWLLLGILNTLRTEPFDPFAPEEERPEITQEEYMRLLSLPRKKVSDG